MNKIAPYILTVLFGSASLISSSQSSDPTRIIESIIEGHLQNLNPGTDVGLIIEDLEEFVENPININSTNSNELSRIYVLDDIQINKLLNYINEYGPAYSIYELNTIDGFTPELLKKAEPFIWFGPQKQEPEKLSRTLKYGKHQLLLRSLGTLQKSKGYIPKEDGTIPFEGNQYRYYARYRFEVNNRISAGFTGEKDPGESFFNGSNRGGFDFYSGHLSVNLNSIVENVTVGDFLVRSGQGLVLWQEYSMGKSENILNLSKTNRGIRPFTSVEENLFFRGIASTLNFGDARLSVFYSKKNDDGNVVQKDSIPGFFTSLQTSGYHRTINEIEDKNAVHARNAGAIFSWNFNYLKVGCTFSYQQFNMPFIRSTQLYNQYRFRGTENHTTGIDYLYNKGKYQLFGEGAISKSKGIAALQGAVAQLNDQLNFSILFRHFDKNYHAYWSNTFAEGSSTSNETGLYMGTKILPVKFISLTAYTDFYSSKWINYSTAAPSKGWDIFTQANFIFSENFEFYIRFKNEEKEIKFAENERFINIPEQLQKTRFHFQYKLFEPIIFKTRFEHALYSKNGKETGFVIFQDLQISPKKLPLNFSLRLAYFNTDSYNTRIYAYENDLLYTFSIPAYFGKGIRNYVNLRYKINDNLDFWFKLANTSWNDRKIISSGNNEIPGNNKTELKFQLRLKI